MGIERHSLASLHTAACVACTCDTDTHEAARRLAAMMWRMPEAVRKRVDERRAGIFTFVLGALRTDGRARTDARTAAPMRFGCDQELHALAHHRVAVFELMIRSSRLMAALAARSAPEACRRRS